MLGKDQHKIRLQDTGCQTRLMAIFALAALTVSSSPVVAAQANMPGGIVDLHNPPIQTTIKPEVRIKNGYTVREVAGYIVTARIVSMHRYHKGRETELSPVDLALGWGRMSEEKLLHKMSFSQDRRRLFLQSSNAKMTEEEIAGSSANTHIIPADDKVEEKIASLRENEVVTLHGALVDVSHPDGWHWNTSVTRNDMGEGACEIMLVDAIVVH